MKFISAEEIFERAGKEISLNFSSFASLNNDARRLSLGGTTIMGLVHKEGILGGCDCQATSSDGNIASSNFKKIIRLDSHSLLAISGVAGLGIEMARLLRTNLCYEADLREGEYVPPKTKANMVADRLRSMFPSAISLNLIVAPILITYDMDKREPGGR